MRQDRLQADPNAERGQRPEGGSCSASVPVEAPAVDLAAAARALRESERRLSLHIERTPLGAIEWSRDRSARIWNPAAERMFGYAAEEVSDCDAFPLLVPEESREHVDRVWDALLSLAGGESSINTNLTKDGRTILCRWYNTPLCDDEGRVVGVASFVEDITQRELAQRELRASERRLTSVVQSLPVLVWALDERLAPTLWNEQAERVTGYAAADMVGKPDAFSRFYGDVDRAIEIQRRWREMGGGDYDEWEQQIRCADGSTKVISWSNIAARCPVPGWRAWGVGIDVTQRRLAETALRESERRFREVLERVDMAGVIVDAQGRVVFINDFFLDLTKRVRDEVIGADYIDLFVAPERQPSLRRELGEMLAGRAVTVRYEGDIRTSAGETRRLVWLRSPIREAGGTIVGAFGLGMDVTDQRRADAELNAYRQQLEKLVEERTEALAESRRQLEAAERLAALGELSAGLGHDIGNVVLPMRCHLEAVDKACELPESCQADLDAISAGLSFLDRLGGSLRTLSRDESAPQESESGGVLLSEWWDECGLLLSRSVADHVRLRVRFEPDLPPVRIAGHRLTRAVLNVIVNASQAIPDERDDGRIELSARLSGDRVVIEVRDNGVGMTREVARRAMEPFFTTRKRGLSTGLGLSLVEGVVRRAGGRVGIESSPGAGARVSLELPAATRSSPALRPFAVVSLPGAREAGLHKSILRSLGFEILVCSARGRVGVDVASAGSPGSVTARLLDRDGRVRAETVIVEGEPAGVADLRRRYADVVARLGEWEACEVEHNG